MAPSSVVLFSPPQGLAWVQRACPAALPLLSALLYLCPLLSPQLLISSWGWGGGLRQGLWCSSQVMKSQVGNSTLCPPPICPHLSVHMRTGYHRPAARVTVGSSEELEVGACSGTILAPSSRLRLAPSLSFLLPRCVNLRDLPSLLRLGFPTWKVHFTLFFNVMLICF